MSRRGRGIRLTGKNVFLILIPIMLVVGVIIGFVIRKNVIKPKYEFKLNGDSVIEMKLGDEYVEQGCIFIWSSKDLSSEIKITKPDFDEVGTYTVRYEASEDMYIERVVIVNA